MIGIDEVGRGSLVGEVYACACFFDDKLIQIPALKDSKKLSPKSRNEIYHSILSLKSIKYSIGIATVDEIDSLNILQATMLAMERAYFNLNINDSEILIDGNCKPFSLMEAKCIIKGDGSVPQISLASVIAKVERDKRMEEISKNYPGYAIEKHKGYGTKQHINALLSLGPTSVHRKSFLKNIAF